MTDGGRSVQPPFSSAYFSLAITISPGLLFLYVTFCLYNFIIIYVYVYLYVCVNATVYLVVFTTYLHFSSNDLLYKFVFSCSLSFAKPFLMSIQVHKTTIINVCEGKKGGRRKKEKVKYIKCDQREHQMKNMFT